MAILILDPISKFSKVKNKTKKDPLNFPKIKNRYKESSNKKIYRKQTPLNEVKLRNLVTSGGPERPPSPNGGSNYDSLTSAGF